MTTAAMQSNIQAAAGSSVRDRVSRWQILIGRGVSGLAVTFMAFDGVMKFVQPAQVVEGSAHLGLGPELLTPVGAVLLVCTALYAIPRTAILGAILLTGYLGGAVFGNLRAGDPLFSHVLFPVYFGIAVWAGLFLRDESLRAFLPFRSQPA